MKIIASMVRTQLPTLVTIIKKIKDREYELSTTIAGLADSIDSAIKRRFSQIFDSHDVIISAVASQKIKLRWVEKQEKKDWYKQMLLDECTYLIVLRFRWKMSVLNHKRKKRKKTFTNLTLMMKPQPIT